MAEDIMASFDSILESGNVPSESLNATATLTPEVGDTDSEDLMGSFESQLSATDTAQPTPGQTSNSTGNLLGLNPFMKFQEKVIKPTFEAVGGFVGTKQIGEELGAGIKGEDVDIKRLAGGVGSTALTFLPGGQLGRGALGAAKLTGKGAALGAGAAVTESLKEGEAPLEDVEAGAGIGAALASIPLVGKGLSKGKKLLEKKNLQKSLDLTNSQISKINKPNIAGIDPEDWLIDRGITGSADEVVDQLGVIGKASKEALDSALEKDLRVFTQKEAVAAAEELANTFQKSLGNEAKALKFLDIATKGDLTLKDINEVKRGLDGAIGMFKVTGDDVAGTRAEGFRNIRSKLKTFVEKNAIDIDAKDLNKTTQVANEIKKAVIKSEGRRGNRNILFTASNLIIGGAGVASGSAIAVPVLIMKTFLDTDKGKSITAKILKSSSSEATKRAQLQKAIKRVATPQNIINILNDIED